MRSRFVNPQAPSTRRRQGCPNRASAPLPTSTRRRQNCPLPALRGERVPEGRVRGSRGPSPIDRAIQRAAHEGPRRGSARLRLWAQRRHENLPPPCTMCASNRIILQSAPCRIEIEPVAGPHPAFGHLLPVRTGRRQGCVIAQSPLSPQGYGIDTCDSQGVFAEFTTDSCSLMGLQ